MFRVQASHIGYVFVSVSLSVWVTLVMSEMSVIVYAGEAALYLQMPPLKVSAPVHGLLCCPQTALLAAAGFCLSLWI